MDRRRASQPLWPMMDTTASWGGIFLLIGFVALHFFVPIRSVAFVARNGLSFITSFSPNLTRQL